MRRLAALIILLVVLAAAGPAQADKIWGTSCGGSGAALNPTWNDQGGGYVIPVLHWTQNCGVDKTIEVELQHNTVSNPQTWVDANCIQGCGNVGQDYQFSTPADLANHLVARTAANNWATYCGNHGWRFRIHVWWSGGDDPGNAVAAPQDC
jgi:hypothetical protein